MDIYFDGWKRLTDFNGVSSRIEFWTFNIVNAILIYALYYFSLADMVTNSAGGMFVTISSLIIFIFAIPYLIASWSIAVRRLHDSGKSGWCLLLGFIPLVGAIILFIFYLLPSE